MELYLNSEELMSHNTISIDDGNGGWYTMAEAKELIESGKVQDMNMSLRRLVNSDWNVEEVKRQYKAI